MADNETGDFKGLVSDCCKAPLKAMEAGGETTTATPVCSKCGKNCGLELADE